MLRKLTLLVFILLLFLFINACSKSEKKPNSDASTLFLDKINLSSIFQSKRLNEWNFQTLTPGSKDTSDVKGKDEGTLLSKHSFRDLTDTILEINFRFNNDLLDKKDNLKRKLKKVIIQARHQYMKHLLKSSASIEVAKKNLASILGDWSFQENDIQHWKSKDKAHAEGIIVNKSKTFINGAVSVKFSFEENNTGKSDNEAVGIVFNMSDDQTGNRFLLFRSGKLAYSIIENGRIKYSYALLDKFPPLHSGNHTLHFIVFNNSLAYKIDNSQFRTITQTRHLILQEGFAGVWTNTRLKISDLYVASIKQSELSGQNNTNKELPFLRLDFSSGDNKRYSVSINKNGPTELVSKMDSQLNLVPGFHKKDHHVIQILTLKDKSGILLDDVLIKMLPFNQLHQLHISLSEKREIAIDEIKTANIKKQTDFDLASKKLKEYSIFEKILKRFKWQRENIASKKHVIGEYRLNHVTRKAVLVLSPSKMSFPVQIPRESFLNFGIGIPLETWGKSEEIIFKIVLKDQQNRENIIFKKSIQTNSYTDRKWLDYRLDLSKYAGFTGEISFFTDSKNDAPGENLFSFALWSDPGIFQKRMENEYNVLLISIDTLRPDHLGCYGYEKDISPHIDQLADEGAVFQNAFSQAPWTLPSHLSMLTSIYPSVFKDGEKRKEYFLSNPSLSIASILQKNGYITGGITGGGNVDPDFGYSQGFNSGYTTTSAKDESQIHESYVIFKEWIKMHKEDRFFLFFHTFEVHDYITAKEKHILKNIDPNNIRLQMLELYDNKIAHMDNYIGLITNDLKKLGIYDKTLIIITSDHGEEFFEHGNLGHQTSLYNELLKVPLIFRLPGKIPSKIKIKNNVRVVDIKTTILSILGIEDENPQEGKSLLSFLDNTEDENRTIFAEETGSVIGEALDIKSIQNDQYKFILSPVATTPPGFNYDIKNFGELYDLNKDLAEKRNLNEKGNLIAKKLKEEIIEITQKNIQLKEILKQNSDKSIEISEETKQRLRALGYIQ